MCKAEQNEQNSSSILGYIMQYKIQNSEDGKGEKSSVYSGKARVVT